MDDIDFSYDGNDEEAKRIASEPKKLKPVKVIPKKKTEVKPVVLPQQPVETSAAPTPVDLSQSITESFDNGDKTITEALVKIPEKIEKPSEINAPLVVIAAVAATASASVAASAFKAKTKLKKNNKAKSDKPENKSKEEKKKEEQKACDSKSDRVQQLIDEVKIIVNNSLIEKVESVSNKKFADKVKALKLEMVLLNKQIKKIEEKIAKRKKTSK